ncbi:10271_t:CDS:2 [Diversispora eburnea]|uniref:10271_t:CDS:1 n=1 Tax=Diversispora eburnea TaxID=1213867 RepID=A0A9N8VUX0_9GLOM|nr:10271_t:CDS:2 [Diversispora eburnea]
MYGSYNYRPTTFPTTTTMSSSLNQHIQHTQQRNQHNPHNNNITIKKIMSEQEDFKKREELINNYKSCFDQLQISTEDFKKRLRSLNRVYKELQRLGFDIETYIHKQNEKKLINQKLMDEFRRVLKLLNHSK